ncbi:MAG: isopeptide-forming domain-containing fimbrial protein, partial [Ruminococcus sp.]|nr:isopeptide-forming domain-containing fimbrial protein [Ruminococcus sp.]
GWQDSADYDIGDDVPFQLKATLPSTYAAYKAYKLTFHDNFRDVNDNEVFTFKQIDKVYVDGNSNGIFDGSDFEIYNYTLKKDATTQKADVIYNMEVEIANLKTVYGGDTPETASVIVEYTATLNDNAVLGSKGNWNDAYLSYTTNPNWNGTGDTDTTPDEEKEHPKDSPIDTTVVFTYQTVINKINPQGEALTGANFVLAKKYSTTPTGGEELIVGEGESAVTYTGYYKVSEITATDKKSFEFKGLDDGDYILVETKAPANYKKATKPVYFTISAVHTNDSDGALELTSLTGAKTAGVTDDGFINLQTIAGSSEQMSSELSSGKIGANFINTSGAELPSTGGIGTKIFYLGGGAMVAVAGVFLITKKRMGKSEN